MPYPSRKIRRKNKTKTSLKGKGMVIFFISLLLLANFFLIMTSNYSLLFFGLPISVFIALSILYRSKPKVLVVNMLILLFLFVIYFEISYRLWAHN